MTEEIRHRRQIEDVGFSMLYHVVTLDKDLSDGAFRLYALLLKYAQQKKRGWPGLDRLADELDKSRVTVSRFMRELTEKGLITRQRRFGTSSITWIEDLNEIYKELPDYIKDDTIDECIENDTTAQGDCIKDDTTIVSKTIRKEEEVKNNKNQEEEEKEHFSEKPDPLNFYFERKTAEAQAAKGAWTVPPEAGGEDPFSDGPVDAFCILAGVSPLDLPRNLRKSWASKLRQIAEKCGSTAEVMKLAIEAIPEDRIGWKSFQSPYADKFEDNIIPLLLRGGQPRTGKHDNTTDKYEQATRMTMERRGHGS